MPTIRAITCALVLGAGAGVGGVALASSPPPDHPHARHVLGQHSLAFLRPLPGATLAGPARVSLLLPRRSRVSVLIDGRLTWRGAATAAGPAVLARLWNTRAAANGRHRIVAVAILGRRRHVVRRRTVTVANPLARPVVRQPRPAPAPSPAPAAAPAPAPQPAAPPTIGTLPGKLIFSGDWETGDTSQWRDSKGDTIGLQEGAPGRITVVTSPVAQGRYAGRFELHPGDVYAGGNRTEVFDWTNEQEGSERWYGWYTLFPTDYPYDTTHGWQIWTQFHSQQTISSPPITFDASGDKIGFTARALSGSDAKPTTLWTGPMNRGQWHSIVLHAGFSTDPHKGFVELWMDGVKVVNRTPAQTLLPGYGDYFKQGLYRGPNFPSVAVVYHDGLTITSINN